MEGKIIPKITLNSHQLLANFDDFLPIFKIFWSILGWLFFAPLNISIFTALMMFESQSSSQMNVEKIVFTFSCDH